MIFYRSAMSQAGRPSVATLRGLTAVSLTAYPAGAAVMAAGSGWSWAFPSDLAGLGLIALALLAAAPVLGSRLQRIVGDRTEALDERELHLRLKALSWGYYALTALVLLAFMYAGFASDAGWWLPHGYHAWNGLFWGAFLYALILPTTFLAWTVKDPEPEL
jgi:uncharacterized membrane protein